MLQEFLRGAVQLHVLHHACEGEIHGAWMSQELARHGHRISPGTLYPLLHRMEAAGLVTSRRDTVAGKVRRVYAATQAGREELAATREALRELAAEVLTGDEPGSQTTVADSGDADAENPPATRTFSPS